MNGKHQMLLLHMGGLALVLGMGIRSASADTIIFDGFKYDNVEITDYKDGGLVGVSSAGEKLYPFRSLDLVQLEGQETFNKAEAARKSKDWTTAGEMYSNALKDIRPKFKKVVEARAIAAFDINGKFPEAMKAFLDIYAASPTAGTYALRPMKLPDAASQSLATAASMINNSLRDKAFNTAVAQQNLKSMLLEIYTQAGDPKATALAAELGVGGPAAVAVVAAAAPGKNVPAAEPTLDLSAIDQALAAKRYDAVIQKADAMLPTADDESAIRLYLAQAQAYVALQKPEEAQAAYLRIAIHYPQNRAQAPRALLAAAELQSRTNPDGAKRLYREILEKYPDSPEALKARTSQ